MLECVVKKFQKTVIRILSNNEKAKLYQLIKTYGAPEILKTLPVLAKHNGQNVAYLETVLSNGVQTGQSG